jgi:phosphatidylinositol alpha-1,6-mannosyltransferase
MPFPYSSRPIVKSLLISGQEFPPRKGGIANYMASIAAALGPEQVCCLTGVRAESNGHRAAEQAHTYRRPAAFAKPWHIQAVGFSAAMAEILLRERPRVAQISTVHDAHMGMWLRQWFGIPYVVYAHGNEILGVGRSSTWQKPRLSLMNADRVLAVSRFTARLLDEIGVPAQKIEIIHPGCDIERFHPREPNDDLREKLLGTNAKRRVILSVGNLVSRKGHDVVIRALPRLMKKIPNVVYLIAGDGPYRKELEDLAAALGVRERVILAGQVSHDSLPDVYALSDVFIMPSRAQLESCDVEGFGIVFLEAGACGKPVIAGRSGGVEDAVLDGTTGILVNPVDSEEVAHALMRVLGDAHLAARLGEQGRKRVVQEFDWKQVGSRVEEVLTSVVARENTASGRP